jgi:hypothetical protein
VSPNVPRGAIFGFIAPAQPAARFVSVVPLRIRDVGDVESAGALILYGKTQSDHYGRCGLSLCARQRDLGYAALSASVAIGRPCAPSRVRRMPASYARPGHDELLP